VTDFCSSLNTISDFRGSIFTLKLTVILLVRRSQLIFQLLADSAVNSISEAVQVHAFFRVHVRVVKLRSVVDWGLFSRLNYRLTVQ